MEADSWTARISSSGSRRHYQSALHSRSDLQLGFEEINGDNDSRGEFPCPFCPEDFDIIGLCCHIDDEHPVEAKNAVCPVCGMRVGMDMVGHITMQHGQFFKMQHRRKILKVGSLSTLSLLRKELREGNLQSFLGGSSYVIPCTSAEPDPLLSSFVHNLPLVDEPKNVQPHSSTTSHVVKKTSAEQKSESVSVRKPPLSDQEQEEKAQRCEFVQGLLLSTILGATL